MGGRDKIMSRLNISSASTQADDLSCFPIIWILAFCRHGRKDRQSEGGSSPRSRYHITDHADVGCDGGGEFGDAEALVKFSRSPELRARFPSRRGGIVLGVPYDSSPSYLRSAVEASLRRLNVSQ